MKDVRLIAGDARIVLPTLPAASFDVVLTDPPYPCIDRSYGRWTEEEWFWLMRAVVPECMRVLKPTGSAVFILQPNSEQIGRMRTWLWEFMAWVGKEWGIVQDAYWWNIAAMPEAHAIQGRLMRPSLKTCVWIGPPGCHRNQDVVLWTECEDMKARRASARTMSNARRHGPSGQSYSPTIFESGARRGGVTPFNVLPIPNANSTDSAAVYGHGAGTPHGLCDWWLRYLCPPEGAVLDPFVGSGTVCLAAMRQGKASVGIDKETTYIETARARLRKVVGPLFEEAS